MTVEIGGKTLPTRRPQDLDKALLAETGCNAAEFARMIGGQPLAGTVASALLPFLPEEGRPSASELAATIEAAGPAGVAAQVARLYAAAGADDLDGLTVAQLKVKADDEGVDLAGLKKLDDIAAAIRAHRLAKAEQAAEVAE